MILATLNSLVSGSASASLKLVYFPVLFTSECPIPGLRLKSLVAKQSHSLSIWYPRHMLQTRVGVFYSAASLAGAFSGLLAFAIEFMDGTRGLESWSWIFVRSPRKPFITFILTLPKQILEGIVTVAVGILAFSGEWLNYISSNFSCLY